MDGDTACPRRPSGHVAQAEHGWSPGVRRLGVVTVYVLRGEAECERPGPLPSDQCMRLQSEMVRPW